MKNDKIKNIIKNILFGGIIGSTMSVPGVSGGSTAIMLGIYEKLISAVSNIKKDIKKNGIFLFEVAFGGIVGLYFVSGGVLWLTENYRNPSMYFFMGAVLGGIPLLVRRSGIKTKTLYKTLYCFFGALAAIFLNFLPSGGSFSDTDSILDWFMLFFCGIIIAAAMVLPGISTSHILLAMGMYESVWGAFHELDIMYLLPIVIGGIVGTLLTAKLTELAIKHFCCQTYMVIIGFVMSTVYDIFPGIPQKEEIVLCIICSAAGFALTGVIMKNYAD